MIDAQFPEKLQFLFEPKRYKIAYGGRGGGKTDNFARALLIMGSQKELRVLCGREFQNSIAESVHKTLAYWIKELGLESLYVVEKQGIRCPSTGTEFFFEGLKNNINRIKSYAKIDICWVEEAVTVSDDSWEKLIPTIRNEDKESGTTSEIWISFNPEFEDDPTYKRFVLNPPKESHVVEIGWRDNPWFPEVLRMEMEELKAKDFEAYLNVWEGKCKTLAKGAVYAKEMAQAELENRICDVPVARQAPVDVFFDLGMADCTSMWFAQFVAMQYRMVDFYENNMEHIDHYIGIMQQKGYIIGTVWLPHDAKAKQLGTKMTIEEQIRNKGFRTRIVPKVSVADGINAVRTILPNAWFDKTKCALGLTALRRYRWATDEKGQIVGKQEPLHDKYSHACDAMRYLALAMREPKSSGAFQEGQERVKSYLQRWKDSWGSPSSVGWMR